MLLTNLLDNNDNNKRNANDLFDELILVNPFTNVENVDKNLDAIMVSILSRRVFCLNQFQGSTT